MKHFNSLNKILFTSVLSLCATSAFANTATMSVKGTLIASSCTPAFSNGGIVDYGNISLNTLSSLDVTQLGEKKIDLTITCSATTSVGVEIADNRSSSVALIDVDTAFGGGISNNPERLFGLGKTAGGVNIGNWTVDFDYLNATADSNPAHVFSRQKGDITWGLYTDFSNAHQYTVGLQTVGNPTAFKVANIPLITNAAVQSITNLAISDDTALDGQATISLVYL